MLLIAVSHASADTSFRLIPRLVALLHRAHREAFFGESVGLLHECVAVGCGQQVEDAVVVVDIVAMRKQRPVGGERVGESWTRIGLSLIPN